MIKIKTNISKTALYVLDRQPDDGIEHLWLVCHGYGQRAEEFLRLCSPLGDHRSLLVAPEGLSRLYLRGGRGEVGASWMTRAERLDEIRDYIDYLDQVLDEVTAALKPDEAARIQLHLLGFSQGASTAMRYALLGARNISTVVLWGSAFPIEEIEVHRERITSARVVVVRGDNDRISPAEEFATMESWLAANHPDMVRLSFPGGHELNQKLLTELRIKKG